MFLEEKRQGEVKKLEEWQQDLLIAADFLERNQWCQGSAHTKLPNGEDAYCLAGALYYSIVTKDKATVVSSKTKPMQEKIAEFLKTNVSFGLINWNDNVAKSKEEVVAVLRKVATGETSC